MLCGNTVEGGDFSSGFPTASDPLEAYTYPEYSKSGWNLNNILSLSGSLLSFESFEAKCNFVPRIHVGMCFSPLNWVTPLIYCIILACTSPLCFHYLSNFLFFSGVKLPDSFENVINESLMFTFLYNHLTKQKVEEHQLYSLCYMHLGEPKVWYSVPRRFAVNFETIWKKYLGDMHAGQPDMHDNLVRI